LHRQPTAARQSRSRSRSSRRGRHRPARARRHAAGRFLEGGPADPGTKVHRVSGTEPAGWIGRAAKFRAAHRQSPNQPVGTPGPQEMIPVPLPILDVTQFVWLGLSVVMLYRLTTLLLAVVLREILERCGILGWMTARLKDPRRQVDVTHDLASLIRTGVLLSAQGWRDVCARLEPPLRVWRGSGVTETTSLLSSLTTSTTICADQAGTCLARCGPRTQSLALHGGDRAAFMYSLIVTAKMNIVDLQAWMADVMARMPGLVVSHPGTAALELGCTNGESRLTTARAGCLPTASFRSRS